jgi:hypothetical protein
MTTEPKQSDKQKNAKTGTYTQKFRTDADMKNQQKTKSKPFSKYETC